MALMVHCRNDDGEFDKFEAQVMQVHGKSTSIAREQSRLSSNRFVDEEGAATFSVYIHFSS